MANIKTVRTIFGNEIKALDSNYQEHFNPFSEDDMNRHGFDKKYKIDFYNLTGSTMNQNSTRDSLEVTVRLYRKGFLDNRSIADDLFDFANVYRMRMMKSNQYKSQLLHIIKIVCRNIAVRPVNGNDNSFIADIVFDVDCIFSTGLNLEC